MLDEREDSDAGTTDGPSARMGNSALPTPTKRTRLSYTVGNEFLEYMLAEHASSSGRLVLTVI